MQETFSSHSDSLSLSFSSYLDVHSSSIQNIYSKKIVQGGTFSETDKEKMFQKHKELNRLGLDYQFSIQINNIPLKKIVKKPIFWNIKAGTKTLFASSYSKDFFGLLTFGNDRFLGDTLDFKASRFNYYFFQKLGLGLTFPKFNSQIFFNFVNLSSFFNGDLDGQFFNESNGNSIYWDAQANWSQNPKVNWSNGIGFSMDYQQTLKFNLNENKEVYFQIKVEDLGLVNLKKAEFQSDTSFTFSGFGVNQLFQISEVKTTENAWMDSLHIKRDTLNSWEVLPFSITLQKLTSMDSSSKWQSFFGVKSYPTLPYFPKIFVGAEFSFRKNSQIGSALSYGGFGGFRWGLYSRLQWKKMSFFIGLEDFISVFSNKMYGKNLNFKWSWRL